MKGSISPLLEANRRMSLDVLGLVPVLLCVCCVFFFQQETNFVAELLGEIFPVDGYYSTCLLIAGTLPEICNLHTTEIT